MPSAKPDKSEVQALLKSRGISFGELPKSIYADLHRVCEHVAGKGHIDQAGAETISQFLSANPAVASVYPNNVLHELASGAAPPASWSSDVEHDLLHVIFNIYFGYGSDKELDSDHTGPRPPRDLSRAISDSSFRSPAVAVALGSTYFDNVSVPSGITGKLVGFTGKFAFGTREDCFNEARRLGAVPSDPTPHLDILFVGQELEGLGVVSAKLDSALYYRRMYGNLKILRERDWLAAVKCG
jgi:hypothetical protein